MEDRHYSRELVLFPVSVENLKVILRLFQAKAGTRKRGATGGVAKGREARQQSGRSRRLMKKIDAVQVEGGGVRKVQSGVNLARPKMMIFHAVV